MQPTFSDYHRNKELMKSWRIDKIKWLAVQSFVLFTMMTALMLSTGLQAQL